MRKVSSQAFPACDLGWITCDLEPYFGLSSSIWTATSTAWVLYGVSESTQWAVWNLCFLRFGYGGCILTITAQSNLLFSSKSNNRTKKEKDCGKLPSDSRVSGSGSAPRDPMIDIPKYCWPLQSDQNQEVVQFLFIGRVIYSSNHRFYLTHLP